MISTIAKEFFKKLPLKNVSQSQHHEESFRVSLLRTHWNIQSQNAILNSWGKPGQKKKILFRISTKKDSGGSKSQK